MLPVVNSVKKKGYTYITFDFIIENPICTEVGYATFSSRYIVVDFAFRDTFRGKVMHVGKPVALVTLF
jgi:hypothetical protein